MRPHSRKLRYPMDEVSVPLHIHYEFRANMRIALGKTAVHLRLPLGLCGQQEKKFEKAWKDWMEQHRETIKRCFASRQYKDGDILRVGERQYTLRIEEVDLANHHGKKEGGTIRLRLNPKDENLVESVKKLLSRIVSADYLPAVKKRVRELNQQHFKAEVGQLRIKYTRSRWGSCSGKKNINLSSRLLFAPQEVRDYVIIHELAHLKEMNHSPKFWALVEKASPNYREHENWLKANGHRCDF